MKPFPALLFIALMLAAMVCAAVDVILGDLQSGLTWSTGSTNKIAHFLSTGNDAYTKLLIHCDGTNGQTAFVDSSSSAKAITTVGTGCKIATAAAYFGTGAITNNGTNAGLSLAQSADFDFGTGDWTIDCWVKPEGTQPANKGNLYTKAASCASIGPVSLAITNGVGNKLLLYLSSNGSTYNILAGGVLGTLTSNAWTHVEVSRSNATTIYCFTNGTLATNLTITNLTLYATSATTLIGFGNYVNSALMGYLDEYRVSKGICRHTANFAKPTLSYGE